MTYVRNQPNNPNEKLKEKRFSSSKTGTVDEANISKSYYIYSKKKNEKIN